MERGVGIKKKMKKVKEPNNPKSLQMLRDTVPNFDKMCKDLNIEFIVMGIPNKIEKSLTISKGGGFLVVFSCEDVYWCYDVSQPSRDKPLGVFSTYPNPEEAVRVWLEMRYQDNGFIVEPTSKFLSEHRKFIENMKEAEQLCGCYPR